MQGHDGMFAFGQGIWIRQPLSVEEALMRRVFGLVNAGDVTHAYSMWCSTRRSMVDGDIICEGTEIQ